MIMFGHREGPQISIGGPVLHDPFVIEFAPVRGALQPGTKYLQFRTLMRASQQQCRIFGLAETVDTNGIL